MCLNMIVKDEAHIIEETLSCMLPYIDCYVISDTGSTDGTPDIITNFFKKHNIPGTVHHDEWKNFGYNRSLALDEARGKSKYIWVIDADDVIVGDLQLPNRMTKDSYNLKYGDGFTYRRTQIFRNFNNQWKWRYVGILHEFPDCNKPNYNKEPIEGNYYVDSRRLGNRSKDPEKYLKDAKAFEAEIEAFPNSELNARYQFYMAQSWMDAGYPQKAIDAYTKRSTMGGWWEEVYESLWKVARLKAENNYPEDEVVAAFETVIKRWPHRAESFGYLAKIMNTQQKFQRAYEYAKAGSKLSYPANDKLFVLEDYYNFKIDEELALAAFYTGRYGEAFDVYEKLVKSNKTPDYEQKRYKAQLQLVRNKLNEFNKQVCVIYAGYEFVDSTSAVWDFVESIPNWKVFIVGDRVCPSKLTKKVTLIDQSAMAILSLKNEIDTLIVYGGIQYFLTDMSKQIKATKQIFWQIGDTFHISVNGGLMLECYNTKVLQDALQDVDTIVCSQEDHKELNKTYEIPEELFHIHGTTVGQGEALAMVEERNATDFTIHTKTSNAGLMNVVYPGSLGQSINLDINIDKYVVLTASKLLERCVETLPNRPEPMLEMAKLHIKNKTKGGEVGKSWLDKAQQQVTDDNPVVQDLIKVEQAKILTNEGNYKRSFRLAQEVLNRNQIPEDIRELIEDTRNVNIAHMKDEFLFYPGSKIQKIVDELEDKNDVRVIFSVTTCHRLDLFEKTMNSFINCCQDTDLIDRWVCVDDNSSSEDREKMKSLYPFFEFIMKTPSEKGHYISMNMILDKLNDETEYLLHLEDDFHFIESRNYVQDSIDVLKSNEKLGQVAFNLNYAEIEPHKQRIGGGQKHTTQNGVRYRIHEHIKDNTPEYNAFMERNDHRLNSAYWPHFTFRPSVHRVKTLRDIGLFYRTEHFEMEYAKEYIAWGYETAFLDTFSSLHIGKKTWEKNKENAYNLNQESQFGAPSDDEISVASKYSLTGPNNNIKVIHKQDQLQQWREFKEQMRKINPRYNYRRIEIEPITTLPTHLMKTFNNGKISSETINLAIAHSKEWSETTDFTTILDYNIELRPDFDVQIERILKNINPDEHQLIYLGFEQDNISSNENVDLVPINSKSKTLLACGYIISKVGAKKLNVKLRDVQFDSSIKQFIANALDGNVWQLSNSLITTNAVITSSEQSNVREYEGYKFFRGMDSHGNDVGYHENKSIEELIKIVDEDERCVAFNTLGWIKHKVIPDMVTLYGARSLDDGLYVRLDRWDEYNRERIITENKRKIMERDRGETESLTFSVTTCKRWSHFKRTMDNLLFKCQDLDIIDQWLCVDDNSSEEDRHKMEEEYPFFEFIFKTPEDKGHPRSMNIILNNVNTDYLIHFEDDWDCTEQFSLRPFLDHVANDETDQIIFVPRGRMNDDFEVEDEIGDFKVYAYEYNHNHGSKPKLNIEYDEEHGNPVSNMRTDLKWWWPGWSLNPSVMNFSKIKGAGKLFSEELRLELFEYDFSHRCREAGINISMTDLKLVHTGDISSYALNDTKRYYD